MHDWSALLLGLGVGGVVGAVAGVVVGVGRLAASFAGFASLLRSYLSTRPEAEARMVLNSFEEVESSVSGLLLAISKVKRAFKWK